MIIKEWNKTDPINGVDADEYFNSLPFMKNSKIIILFIDQSNNVTSIQDVEIIRKSYGIEVDKTPIEVGELYLQKVEESNKLVQEQQNLGKQV